MPFPIANTTLADALKLADALAVTDAVAGRETIVPLLDFDDEEGLRAVLARRSYLPDMIIEPFAEAPFALV